MWLKTIYLQLHHKSEKYMHTSIHVMYTYIYIHIFIYTSYMYVVQLCVLISNAL